MKFKVGDKVRVVDAGTPAKKKYIGRVFTITEVSKVLNYPYSVLDVTWLWRDNELESVDTEFTKSNLQCGMVVELRNGDRKMVLGDKFMDEHGHYLASSFNDILENHTFKLSNIDKVYKSNACTLSSYFDDENLELIWERHPVKRMTIAEIEKELGYKIEIVVNKEKVNNDSK